MMNPIEMIFVLAFNAVIVFIIFSCGFFVWVVLISDVGFGYYWANYFMLIETLGGNLSRNVNFIMKLMWCRDQLSCEELLSGQ